MYKAYETLDTPTKNQIENLKANNWLKIGGHDHARDFRPPGVKPAASVITAKIDPKFIADNPPTVHPVVRVHPETGRKCLYVHPATTHSIVGYSEDESRKLLYHLFSHMTKPEHYVRHKWTKGDVVMWDNRCTMHAATTSGMPSTNHRTVYRVTVDAPVF